MKKQKRRKTGKKTQKTRFLEVEFAVARDGHPRIYDFFLEHLDAVLLQLGQKSCELVIERLEPLNLLYSHLNVSGAIMRRIFLRYCKSHKLTPFSSFHKIKTSCRGKIQTTKIKAALRDYNLLFDLFYSDVRIKTSNVFIDAMDLFSNRILVEASPRDLEGFKKRVKKMLPKTRFAFL